MISYSKYFEMADTIIEQNGWSVTGTPERQVRGQSALVRYHKLEILIMGIGKIFVNLELGRADLSKDTYQLEYFSYHFMPLDARFKVFRVDNDSRQGLHANDDKEAHHRIEDGLDLAKVNLVTFLGLVVEYLHTGKYPFTPHNFGHANSVLNKYWRRVIK